VIIILFAGLGASKKKRVGVYLAGVSVDSDARVYRNSLSGETEATSRNMYLDSIFGEGKIRRPGEIICSAIIVVALIASGFVPPVLL
jgi:ech hydrogenase subunit A